MTGATLHPVELVMAAGLAVVGIFLLVVMLWVAMRLGITAWRWSRQAMRDRRRRKRQVGGPG